MGSEIMGRLSEHQLQRMRELTGTLSGLRDRIAECELTKQMCVTRHMQVAAEYQTFTAQITDLLDLGDEKVMIDWETGEVRKQAEPQPQAPFAVVEGGEQA